MSEELSRSDLARALAALRQRVQTNCVVCGREITGMKHRRTCSDVCRSKAYRLRQKERAQRTTTTTKEDQT
jgi:hypothetical protein